MMIAPNFGFIKFCKHNTVKYSGKLLQIKYRFHYGVPEISSILNAYCNGAYNIIK